MTEKQPMKPLYKKLILVGVAIVAGIILHLFGVDPTMIISLLQLLI